MRLIRNAHMRLVRDDDPVGDGDQGQVMVEDQQVVPVEEQARPRAARKRARQDSEQAPEAPDGQVAEQSDDEESSPCEPVDLTSLEALLFSTHHPLTAGRVAELLDLETTKAVRGAIRELNGQYESTNRAFRVEQVAGGYQILTLPQFGELLRKLHQRDADAKLTKAALETLAIIAYKQPILRVDVEGIRGVACGETIRSLMEKHLVKIAGRAEEPGRPILYGTTRRFLELFGLNSLKDLPQTELHAPAAATSPAAPAVATPAAEDGRPTTDDA
jgi:segregation and condensation protein B